MVIKNIRKLEYSDVPFYNMVRNECCEFLHDPTTYTLPETYKWYFNNNNPFFIYEIDNEMVGYFRTSNWKLNSCYVGMDIHKDYRGKGLAYDAYKLFFKYLNNKFDILRFYLEVLESNTRALSLYKKLGFTQMNSYITKHNVNSLIMRLE